MSDRFAGARLGRRAATRVALALLALAVPVAVASADSGPPKPGPLATTPVSARSNVLHLNGHRIWIAATLRRNTLTADLKRDGVTLATASEKELPRDRGDGEYPISKLVIKLQKTTAHGGTATLRMQGKMEPPASGSTGHDNYAITDGVRWRVTRHSSLRFDPTVVP